MATRRKCPIAFTSDVVLECLRSSLGDLSEHVKRCRDTPGEHLFRVNYSVSQDKEALLRYRSVLTRLLLANPCAIMKKAVLKEGIKKFDMEVGGFLGKPADDRARIETYNLAHLVLTVKSIRKNSKTGTRLPSYLKELVSLLEEGVHDEADDDDNDKDCKDDDDDNDRDTVAPADLKLTAWRAEEHERWAHMSSLRRAFPGRRLLRRLTTSDSEVATPAYAGDCGAVADAPGVHENVTHCAQTHEQESAPSTAPIGQENMVWYSCAEDCATKLVDGVAHKSVGWTNVGGFRNFHFDDDTHWQSEEPTLDPEAVRIEEKIVKKSPACGPLRSSPWKRAYSTAYHGARAEYANMLKLSGRAHDPEEQKALIQRRISEAQAAFKA